MSYKELGVFMVRMKKLNIEIELAGNLPWIYITSINRKPVTEKFRGNHGFTIAFAPIRVGQEMEFTDTKEIFKLIRKYI